MSETKYSIRPFDPQTATDAEFKAVNAFDNQMLAERQPEDPPLSLERSIARWQSTPSFIERKVWLVWDAAETAVVGRAVAAGHTAEVEDNQHLLQFNLGVLPAHRRQGWGHKLLALVVAAAQAQGRRLIITETNARVPAGAAFMQRLGAERGLETHINQLDLTELDRNLLAAWQAQASQRAPGFVLGLWEGSYPEADLEAVVALYEVMNQQPFDDLDVEAFHINEAQLRQVEQMLTTQGYERWTMFVRQEATGALAGFTEVMWHPERPHILQQGNTGVFPEFRSKGLGKWLKAAMLDKVLAERPPVRFVRTGNADSNAPMLKINRDLGFKPYLSQTVWQVETETALAYLAEKGITAPAPTANTPVGPA